MANIRARVGKKIAAILVLAALAWSLATGFSASHLAFNQSASHVTVADGGGITSGPGNPG